MRNVITGLSIAAMLGLSATGAWAQTALLGDVFRDHAVVQRGQPIKVWGEAAPGAQVDVSLNGQTARATADAKGVWQAALPAMTAGGPYVLEARSGGGSATASDIMVGDVFLCSGQSNMQFEINRSLNWPGEVARSANANIRMLTIPQQQALAPQAHFQNPVNWQVASPDVTANWSAACYYFGREIEATQKVPVGLINASWGGSNLRTWLRADYVRQIGGFDDHMDVMALKVSDPSAAARTWGENFAKWWAQGGDKSQPWASRATDIAKWPAAGPVNDHWDKWPSSPFADYNGSVWMAVSFKLTKAQAAQSGTLSLGTIDDVDQTWLNGAPVGYTAGAGDQRNYTFAAGALRAGDNVVVINVLDLYANGGLYGPGPRQLVLADGTEVSLETDWRYTTVAEGKQWPPRAPWDTLGGLTIIGNAMINPLSGYGLKGVLWYQGESNVGESIDLYKRQLDLLMADWRDRFGPEVPFLIVQLANYGTRTTVPGESGWANIREAERLAVLGDKHAGLAIAIDIGDPRDIHPADKNTLGRRLAQAGRAVIYGEKIPASGPAVQTAERTGDTVTVRFADVSGELVAYGAPGPIGFELCGPSGCRYAVATLRGQAVELSGAGDATKVRFCWGDSPTCTLYDRSGAPAGPFEVAIKP